MKQTIPRKTQFGKIKDIRKSEKYFEKLIHNQNSYHKENRPDSYKLYQSFKEGIVPILYKNLF